MSKFKVGDRVKSIGASAGAVYFGGEFEVASCNENTLVLVGHYGGWYPGHFTLIKPASDVVPHKHAELIKQWADNPKLQVQFRTGPNSPWHTLLAPEWETDHELRIKPEPKPEPRPDTVLFGMAVVTAYQLSGCLAGAMMDTKKFDGANVKFIFDGETGKLTDVCIIYPD